MAEWGLGLFRDITWDFFQGPGCLAEPKGRKCSLGTSESQWVPGSLTRHLSVSGAKQPLSCHLWSPCAPVSFFSLRVALPASPRQRTDRAASQTLRFQVTGPSLGTVVPLCPGHGSHVPGLRTQTDEGAHLWSAELWLEPRWNNTDDEDDRDYGDSGNSLHILSPYYARF